MADYIPDADAAFNSWVNNLVNKVIANQGPWGIPGPPVNTLVSLNGTWNSAYALMQNPSTATTPNREAKNDARQALQDFVRQFVKEHLAANSAVTNSDKADMMLTIPDDEPTAAVVPNWSPTVAIDSIRNQMHILRITNPQDPETQAKPEGADAMEVHRFIGTEQPPNFDTYKYIGDARKHLFESKFEPEDQGQRAWYTARYKSTRGETGPFSEPIVEDIA